jgi:hypothetical protein
MIISRRIILAQHATHMAEKRKATKFDQET